MNVKFGSLDILAILTLKILFKLLILVNLQHQPENHFRINFQRLFIQKFNK